MASELITSAFFETDGCIKQRVMLYGDIKTMTATILIEHCIHAEDGSAPLRAVTKTLTLPLEAIDALLNAHADHSEEASFW